MCDGWIWHPHGFFLLIQFGLQTTQQKLRLPNIAFQKVVVPFFDFPFESVLQDGAIAVRRVLSAAKSERRN